MKTLKFALEEGVTRRFGSTDDCYSFEMLCDIVYTLFPELNKCQIRLSWKDDEGDNIVVSSDAEIQEAFSIMSKQGKGYIKFDISKLTSTSEKSEITCVHCKKISTYPYFQSSLHPQLILCNSCESQRSPFYAPMLKVYQPYSTTSGVSALRDRCTVPKEESFQKISLATMLSPRTEPFTSDMSKSCDSLVSSLTTTSAGSATAKPKAKFLLHATFPDSSQILGGASFIKTWRVKNDGSDAWPVGCVLATAGGDALYPQSAAPVRVPVPCVGAGQDIDISVELTAPTAPGRYQGYFRLQTREGKWFGQRLWADIRVLDVEQQEQHDVDEEEEIITPTLEDIAGDETEGVDENAEMIVSVSDSSAACTVRAAGSTAAQAEGPLMKWRRELAVLAGMGFTDAQANVVLLERHSAAQREEAGTCSSQITMQLTVASLLGVS